MIEFVLVIFIIGLLLSMQWLSVKLKLVLGIPFATVMLAYFWFDASAALHLKVLLTVVILYGLHQHYKTYVASRLENTDKTV